MPQFTVTSVPSRVADALAVPAARRTAPDRAVVWIGWLENAGPGSIFLVRSVAAPDPALVIGARLTRNARRWLAEYTEATYGGAWWAWTARATDQAVILAEPGAGGLA